MKTAFVTGASAGFGQAICRRLVAEGYRVIGGARRMDKLQRLEQELGENFIALELDVTDKTSLERAVEQIHEASLAIDCWSTTPGWRWASNALSTAARRTGNA